MHFEQLHCDVALGVPLIAAGLFSMVLQIKTNISIEMSMYFRKLSSLIYFIHMIVLDSLRGSFAEMDFTFWIVVLSTCILLSYVLLTLMQIRYFKWLRILN